MLASSIIAVILFQFQDKSVFSFTPIDDPDLPEVDDPGFRVEKAITGLALPTSMAFLDEDGFAIDIAWQSAT